jgi:hypothetical protein
MLADIMVVVVSTEILLTMVNSKLMIMISILSMNKAEETEVMECLFKTSN